jgi:hypothetical protein
MPDAKRPPNRELALGLLGIVAGVVLAIFTWRTATSPLRLAPGLVSILGGLVLVLRGMHREVTAGTTAVLAEPEPRDAPPRPRTLLEVLRYVLMIGGACSAIAAATAYRVAIYDEEHWLTSARAASSLLTFVVGSTLFLRAYHVGTTPRELPPKADLWDRVVAWIEDHGALPVTLILTIASAVMFAGVFNGESIGDDLTFHMAESARLADCIREGDWDFWNPSANGGYASMYYYQVIPQLASAIPTALFGDHLFWFQLSLWLPLVAVPFAAYRGMRMMGATPWQAATAAFAVTFVSGASRWGSGADGSFQVGLYTQTWALAAFPLGLGYGVRYLTDGTRLPAAVAWGAFVFLCHPFASIALCLGLAVGVLAHYLQYPVTNPRLRAALLAVLALAIAFVAFKVVTDRPQPPEATPDAPVAPIKYIYLPVLLFLVGITARVATSGKRLVIVLLAVLGVLLIANLLGFLTHTTVPKRPEGATEDLPAQWQLQAASFYLGPALLALGLIARLVLRLGKPDEPAAAPGARMFVRLCVIGACLAIATLPGWITVIVDRDGFGGFPHRVSDEVGPGYQELARWYTKGMILDNGRLTVLTWGLPLVLVFARMRFGKWLWAPALTFATLLAIGPHAPKTADDLLPAVRFLGAMQIVLGLAIGAGMFALGRDLWLAGPEHPIVRFARLLARRKAKHDELSYGIRTVIIAATCALAIFVALMGGRVLAGRVNTLYAFDYRDELYRMNEIIKAQPQGKKQVGPGCENHWWNLLSYVYVRRPSLLQMGGGGLQASPNYDFVYSVREFPKLAWVYDVPLFLYAKASGGAPDGEILGQTERYELRRLPAPGPVSPIQVGGVLPEGESRAGSPVRVAAIEWLKTEQPLHDLHLAYYGHGGLMQAPDAKVLRAFRVDPSPGDLADIYAEVEVKQPTTFVARESWHPRWHAYVDGVEVPIRRVTPDFPAIDVPVGTHTLAFRFERPWWAHAAWLAWPGVSLAAFVVLRRLRRRTKLPTARAV